MKKWTTKKIIIVLSSIMVLFPIVFPIFYTLQNQFFYPTYAGGFTGIPPHTGKFICSHFETWSHGVTMEDYCDYPQFKKEFINFYQASSKYILTIYSFPIRLLGDIKSSKKIPDVIDIFLYILFIIPFYIFIISTIVFLFMRKKTDKNKGSRLARSMIYYQYYAK